jgi:hypothetical protein
VSVLAVYCIVVPLPYSKNPNLGAVINVFKITGLSVGIDE